MIGETVIAMGNPFGFENSVTTGLLSVKNRTINFRGEDGIILGNKALIQTDVLINPANSCGIINLFRY